MTDPHAKAVEAAALALINQDRARFELPPHAASSEAFDEGRKATGIATTAITAYLAAMRAEGWVMVRVPNELSTQMHPDDMDEDQIKNADWRYAYGKMVEGVAAMMGGNDDER